MFKTVFCPEERLTLEVSNSNSQVPTGNCKMGNRSGVIPTFSDAPNHLAGLHHMSARGCLRPKLCTLFYINFTSFSNDRKITSVLRRSPLLIFTLLGVKVRFQTGRRKFTWLLAFLHRFGIVFTRPPRTSRENYPPGNGSVLWRMKPIPIFYISIRVWPFPVRLV